MSPAYPSPFIQTKDMSIYHEQRHYVVDVPCLGIIYVVERNLPTQAVHPSGTDQKAKIFMGITHFASNLSSLHVRD